MSNCSGHGTHCWASANKVLRRCDGCGQLTQTARPSNTHLDGCRWHISTWCSCRFHCLCSHRTCTCCIWCFRDYAVGQWGDYCTCTPSLMAYAAAEAAIARAAQLQQPALPAPGPAPRPRAPLPPGPPPPAVLAERLLPPPLAPPLPGPLWVLATTVPAATAPAAPSATPATTADPWSAYNAMTAPGMDMPLVPAGVVATVPATTTTGGASASAGASSTSSTGPTARTCGADDTITVTCPCCGEQFAVEGNGSTWSIVKIN